MNEEQKIQFRLRAIDEQISHLEVLVDKYPHEFGLKINLKSLNNLRRKFEKRQQELRYAN